MDEGVYTNPLNERGDHVSFENRSHKNTDKGGILLDDCYAVAEVSDDAVRHSSIKSEESESNMEFRMVQQPDTAAHGEFIYAVVSKNNKTRNPEKLEQLEYSNIGPNGSVRNRTSVVLKRLPLAPVIDTSHMEYDSLDDVAPYENGGTLETTKSAYGAMGGNLTIASNKSIASNISTNSKATSHRYKFPAVFLGSMVVDLEKLKDDKNGYMISCIQAVAAQSSEATTTILRKGAKDARANGGHYTIAGSGNVADVTLSTHRGMNVVIVLEGNHVKVVEKKSNLARLDIPLKAIRLWGTGKGPSSREFAIISKDSLIKTQLCRVFLCEILSSTVANIFMDVCGQMASPKSSSPVPEHLKKTVSTGSIPSASTVRSSRSEGSRPSNASLRDLTKCYYKGMMEINKTTGTKTIERAIDLVNTYVSKEFWQKGKLLTTPDGISFINDGTFRLTCPNSSITFVGPSTKHQHLVGIIVRKHEGTFAHIFSMETDLSLWFENMKFISKLHSTKFDKATANLLNKRARNLKS